jgi:tRNA-dihydrouridine synthase
MPSPQPLLSLPQAALTALAPMQDVTNLSFMRVIAHYGGPDCFFTEYFRVHEAAPKLNPRILASITENDTGKPIFAQLIGEDIPALVRAAQQLCRYDIAGVDLNLGCPAPRVYRKNVGGGLLREPERVDRILGALRQAMGDRPFTVKMRLGFDSTEHFPRFLDLLERHRVDLLSLHGRTVQGLYHSEVNYDLIAQAVERLPCPVLANGNIHSAAVAQQVLDHTCAAGVMIGRGAIANPWIFSQVRQQLRGEPVTPVTLPQLREYIERLRHTPNAAQVPEPARLSYLKMFLNYIAPGVDARVLAPRPETSFLKTMRRTQSEAELLELCDKLLLSN